MSLSSVSEATGNILSPEELASKDRSNEVELYQALPNFPSLISDLIVHEDFSDVYIASGDFNYYGYSPVSNGWGGTYHCFQTLYSGLLKIPHLKEHLGKVWIDSVPSLLAIQKKLEEAWAAGFDPDGAEYYNKAVFNTKKRIGCTEIWTLLRFLQISCKIVDFPVDPKKVVDWIVAYYTKEFERVTRTLTASAVESDKENIKTASPKELVVDLQNGDPRTFIAPIYLQGEGRSTIAFAVEGTLNQRNILVVDASLPNKVPELKSAAVVIPALQTNKGNINLGNQCQLLFVDSLTPIPDNKKLDIRFPDSDLVV